MDDLIIHILGGTGSPFEEERLKRWREAAPENEKYFQEMVQVWSLTAPEPTPASSGPPDVQDILDATPVPFDHARPSGGKWANGGHPATRARPPWLGWGLLAASVAAVGLGIQTVSWGGPDPMAVYQAIQDPGRTVTLEDGSFVRLAEGSTLQEWDVEGRREVSLDGKAFFAVARDEARPFVVRAGAGEITVLGTRFQVEVAEDYVETVVVEGLVRVSNDGGFVNVPAGSVARMGAQGEPRAEEADDVFALLNWPNGVLVFQATPLSQVAEEVSRQYGRPLRVGGPDLSRRRVTAWFQGESFEAVAESLCVVTEAVCRAEGESVTMEMSGVGGGS